MEFVNYNNSFCIKNNEKVSSDKQENTFSDKIKLRELNLQLNITKFSDNKETKLYYSSNVKKIKKEILPLCKSNLQKSIRRKDEEKAIRTALAIFNYNPNELLRRLPIIMIEDCLPHPILFLKLIWFMCAVSKGYIMTISELEEILGIVSTMCESNEYEVFNSKLSCKNPINTKDWDNLPNDQKNFLWAMEIRKIYGGMGCDKVMLSYHQELWYERFTQKTDENCSKNYWWDKIINQPIYTIDLDTVDTLDKSDILPESIDQHPFPFIKKKISEKTGFSQEEIGLIIWMCRSRINLRQPITISNYQNNSSNLVQNYRKIKKELEGFVNWLLTKLEIY